MKALSTGGLLITFVLAPMLLVGCTSVSIPRAKAYSVRAGDLVFLAKTVKIHGSWAELGTDNGPVWVSGAVITPKN
jgi:hypothetical protein